MNPHEPADVDRLRAALAAARPVAGTPLDAERIFDALHGNLSDQERRLVIDELIANPEAAEAWRLAQELAPPASAGGATRSDGAWRWWSAAAVALLAVGVVWQFANPWQSEPPAYRSTEQRSISSLLPPDQALSRSAAVLRWTGIDGARYRVTVLTPTLDVIDESNSLSVPEYRIGPEVLARVPPGGQLLWQVEARMSGEGSIASPTFSVRVE